MSINQLIVCNLRNNLKTYFLYVFALIFSVALYFSFVNLKYDPVMNKAEASVQVKSTIQVASVVLTGIIAVFLFYANAIFMKRRSKEIALFQLIGLTKGKIFTILSLENSIIYFGSTFIGTVIGFIGSKLVGMMLLNIMKLEAIVTLRFSLEALLQSLFIFVAIFLCILLINYVFIKKHSILALFRVTSSTDLLVKKVSCFEMTLGLTGIALMVTGYYISSKLFDGGLKTEGDLMLAMLAASVVGIIGTYLFYKSTISFVMYVVRKRKGGYLNVIDVLSLSSIMFRMKKNAVLLTIITTASALSIGLLSLSYISYSLVEKNREAETRDQFSILSSTDAERFKNALDTEDIAYNERALDIIELEIDLETLMNLVTNGDDFILIGEDTFRPVSDDIQPASPDQISPYFGIKIIDSRKVEQANHLFKEAMRSNVAPYQSLPDMRTEQKQSRGLTMFIVGFLGLIFLITSGCILYFKQMDESEEERSIHTILRKLGFTPDELLKGIHVKQMFTFGIPLLIGLIYSYFTVRSIAFFFKTETWTPMIIVMVLYSALYSTFALLSVIYNKRIIKEVL